MSKYYEDLFRMDVKFVDESAISSSFLCVSLEDLANLSEIVLKNEWLDAKHSKLLTFARKYAISQ